MIILKYLFNKLKHLVSWNLAQNECSIFYRHPNIKHVYGTGYLKMIVKYVETMWYSMEYHTIQGIAIYLKMTVKYVETMWYRMEYHTIEEISPQKQKWINKFSEFPRYFMRKYSAWTTYKQCSKILLNFYAILNMHGGLKKSSISIPIYIMLGQCYISYRGEKKNLL